MFWQNASPASHDRGGLARQDHIYSKIMMRTFLMILQRLCFTFAPAVREVSRSLVRLNRDRRKERFLHCKLAWEIVPRSPVEKTTCSFLVHPAPLLKEKSDSSSSTLVSDFDDPSLLYRSRSRSGFAADNHPIDTI